MYLSGGLRNKKVTVIKLAMSACTEGKSFIIHRLHLMQYRQNQDDSLDNFITLARTLANKCQFHVAELSKCLIELIIASTPYDGFSREHLGIAIGYPLKDVLK